MHGQALDELELIVPNLNWRYSGVTATNRALAPLMANHCRVAWLGPHRPASIPRLGIIELLRLRFRPPRRRAVRIWHARRNVEMIVGVLLRALGFRLGLVFTSAAQRHHTWITRFLIARMDAIIATTEAAASYLRRTCTVIHHGVDTELYRPPADRQEALAAAGLPGKYGIGAFGRVRPQKGTDVFIAAMCRLLPHYPDFTAIVIGRVTLEHRVFFERLRSEVEKAGLRDRVHFLGELPIAEVPRWYQRIAIYAFASREEGFGLTLVEAMAAGTALVAARAGAAETVVSDGDTGVLVAPGDVDQLVRALEPLMREPQRAADMGRRARDRAVAQFSLAREAERIAAVYRQIWEGEKN
ncbi:MAG: glycosyltransferase family 4 protein [Xanthobacteraceae bacterium]